MPPRNATHVNRVPRSHLLRIALTARILPSPPLVFVVPARAPRLVDQPFGLDATQRQRQGSYCDRVIATTPRGRGRGGGRGKQKESNEDQRDDDTAIVTMRLPVTNTAGVGARRDQDGDGDGDKCNDDVAIVAMQLSRHRQRCRKRRGWVTMTTTTMTNATATHDHDRVYTDVRAPHAALTRGYTRDIAYWRGLVVH